MAIKIQGTTVIDDSRNATALTNLSFDSITLNGTTVVANADELNRLQGVTNPIDSQLGALAKDRGTLNKTFASGETAAISLTSAFPSDEVPVLSVTKEVPQTGVTSNDWDVASDGANYTLHDTAYDTTLTPGAIGVSVQDSTFTSNSVDISDTDARPHAVFFKPDGTKMFTVGDLDNRVYEYDLSTPYDVSSAVYANKSFNVGTQEGNPYSLFFRADGNKMYVSGNTNFVYEYDLATAWDISTASYSSRSFDVGAQGTTIRGLFFKDDGTKMFTCPISNDTVFEYSLSSAWDVSTATYSGNSLSVNSEDGTPNDLVFTSDGGSLLIAGEVSEAVLQYDMTTAWDVSTASYSGNSFSVSAQETLFAGLNIIDSQNKMYTVGEGGVVNEFDLGVVPALILGSGSFASTDVGKRIVGNGGEAILTATDGSYEEQTAFNDNSTIAAGDWSMFALDVESADAGLILSSSINNYAISTASYTGNSFSVSSQESVAIDKFFRQDGLKLYVCGFGNTDTIYEYDLTTAWDISTAAYSGNSFSVSTQATPAGVFFKPDGLKMFVLGADNIAYEYNLSTAWDVTSASYSNNNFDVSSQATNQRGFFFKPDGTKMYILDAITGSGYEYDLSTPWSITSASYNGASFDFSSEDSDEQGLFITDDGTKMFYAGASGKSVYEYNLSTAWDISSASYTGNSFDTSIQGTLVSVFFKPDGSKMYIIASSVIYSYNTEATAFPTAANHTAITSTSTNTEFWVDINSMTADDESNDGSVYYAVSTDDRTTWKIIDDAEGTERSIVRNNGGTWEVNDASDYGSETWVAATENDEFYALEEAVDVDTAQSVEGFAPADQWSYDNVSFSVSGQDTVPLSITFNNDGTKLYMVGSSNDSVYQYTLSTAFDLSTASYDSVSFGISGQDNIPRGITFNSDGTKLYMLGQDNTSVYQYSLSTAFDLTTASYDSISFDVGSQDTSPFGITFNNDGTKLYMSGSTSKSVYQYSLSTAFDLTTASYDSISFDVSSQGEAQGITFNSDGTKMYLIVGSNGSSYQYSLSTAFDLSTASYDSISFDVGSQDGAAQDIVFNNEGTKMYIVGASNADIYQYSSGTTTSTNRMDATQLNAVSDANHYTLGNDLDLAITMFMADGNTSSPTSDGVSINYDANALNQSAIPGTDYDYDFPSSDTVRFTALSPENFKIRVA